MPRLIACPLLTTLVLALPAAGQCDPATDFAIDLSPGWQDLDTIWALETFDPGGGQRLYAGRASGLWEYSDGRWTPVPGAPLGIVALQTWDDGGGPDLYAGTDPTIGGDHSLHRWDGATWTVLGTALGLFQRVSALGVHDFDPGVGLANHLFVGGSFSQIGGVSTTNAAYWDGTSFNAFVGPVGWARDIATSSSPDIFFIASDNGLEIYGNDTVRDDVILWGELWAVEIFDGEITAGGLNGFVSGGFTGNVNGTVYDMLQWDDGTGLKLYIAGGFSTAPGLTGLGGIVALDTAGTWHALDNGVGAGGFTNIYALAIFDESTAAGESLYMGGNFPLGSPPGRSARWGCAIPEPVVADPQWTHTNTLYLADAIGAHHSEVDDALYVGRRNSTYGPKGLYRLDLDNTLTPIWTGDDVASVEIDDAGNIYTTDDFGGQLYRVDHGQTTRSVWVAGWHSGDDDPVGMAFLDGTAAGAFGPAFMVDRGSGNADEVWNWSPLAPEGESVLHADDGTLVNALDVTTDGTRLWIVDSADANPGVIYEVGATGTLTPLATSEPIGQTSGVVHDPMFDALLVLDGQGSGGGFRVVSASIDTGQVDDVITGLTFGVSTWTGVDLTADESRLYVTDGGAGRIYEYTRDTNCPAGDVTGDYLTDVADLTAVADDWDCTGCECVGDATGDCTTGLPDLGVVMRNLDQTCPGLGASGGAPNLSTSINVYETPWPDTPPSGNAFYTVDLVTSIGANDNWTGADVIATVLGDGVFDYGLAIIVAPSLWAFFPNEEFKTWVAAPPDFSNLLDVAKYVATPTAFRCAWYPLPVDGQGDHIITRYTIELSPGESADGLRLTTKPAPIPYLQITGAQSSTRGGVFLDDVSHVIYATYDCIGDVSGDGVTNLEDYVTVLNAILFGTPDGDIDGDQDTDRSDVALLLSDLGCPNALSYGGGAVSHDVAAIDNTGIGSDIFHPEFAGGVTHFTFDLDVQVGDDAWTTGEAMLTLDPGYEVFQHSAGLDTVAAPPPGIAAIEFDTALAVPDYLPSATIIPNTISSTPQTYLGQWASATNVNDGSGTIMRFTLVVPPGSPAPQVIPQGGAGPDDTVIGALTGLSTVASTGAATYAYAYDIILPAEDTCPWDCADGDGTVGINDFLALLGQWGQVDSCDFDGSGVGVTDFLEMLGNWGPCPD